MLNFSIEEIEQRIVQNWRWLNIEPLVKPLSKLYKPEDRADKEQYALGRVALGALLVLGVGDGRQVLHHVTHGVT